MRLYCRDRVDRAMRLLVGWVGGCTLARMIFVHNPYKENMKTTFQIENKAGERGDGTHDTLTQGDRNNSLFSQPKDPLK